MKGIILAEKTYEEVDKIINEDTIIVLPIGGALKEHGPHLPCGCDYYIVQELAKIVVEKAEIVLLPTLKQGYYPAFIDWPGSVSLNPQLFMDVVADIIRPFAKRGVKKFLLLDIGVSTQPPLRLLSSELHNELGIYLAVTDFEEIWGSIKAEICEQEKGGHGDEVETSLLLSICPELVNMDKAVEDYTIPFPGTVVDGRRMVRIGSKMTTKNGIHGNPTFATKEKGDLILEKSVDILLNFINEFKCI